MKKLRTVFTKRLLLGIALTLGVLVGLSGCITAATVATIVYIKSQMEYTVVVELEAQPSQVYDAMQKVASQSPGAIIEKQDPDKYSMEVRKGTNKVKAIAKGIEGGKTELKVTGRTKEEDTSHEEFALRIVERICNELGVHYQVVEKKKLLK